MMRKQLHQFLLVYVYIYAYIWALKRITALFALSNPGLDLSGTIQGAGGVGGLLSMVEGSNTYHYCFDANGNVGQMVDSADGTIKAAYEYSPFGNIIKQSGDLTEENVFRFSTQYFDNETGLIAYKLRYYDPEMGRWINRDPLEELGSILLRRETEKEKADLNLYVFIGNNSIINIDALGLHNYKGYCRYISGGEVFGGGVIRCKVWTTSPNRDCMAEEGELVVMLGGVTVGWPIGVTYFNIDMNSPARQPYASLSEMEGISSIACAGAAVGPLGGSVANLELGYTSGNVSGWQAGVDKSADAFIGYSWIKNKICRDINTWEEIPNCKR